MAAVVAAALIDDRGRWLMHKRPARKHHGGHWEHPGGKVESGETSTNALVREIADELGVAIRTDNLQAAVFAQNGGGGGEFPIVILLYTSRVWSGVPQAIEGGAIGWFTLQEVAMLKKPLLDRALLAELCLLLDRKEKRLTGCMRLAEE